MAYNPKQFLDLTGLTTYDEKIKALMDQKDKAIDAKSLKKVIVDGDTVKFYKNADAQKDVPADFSVKLTSSEVAALKAKMGDAQLTAYNTKTTVSDILNILTGVATVTGSVAEAKKAGTDAAAKADAAQKAAEAAQAKADKNETAVGTVANDLANTDKKVTANEAAITKLNGNAEVAGSVDNKVKTAVDGIKGNAASDTAESLTLEGIKKYSDKKDQELKTSRAKVATTGKAADVSVDTADAGVVANTVQGAIKEIAKKASDMQAAGAVTVEKSNPTEVAARYTIKQGGQALPITIDIPKDMVLKSGEVVVLNQEEATQANAGKAGTYIKLVLNDEKNTAIYIAADSLIEYVTSGSQVGDKVQINIDEQHKVTASIKAASIAKGDLTTDVQASLEKADTALQKANITSGTNNGTIAVGGTDVAVKGLGTAAYAAESSFEAKGVAEREAQKAYNAFSAITEGEINKLFGITQ